MKIYIPSFFALIFIVLYFFNGQEIGISLLISSIGAFILLPIFLAPVLISNKRYISDQNHTIILVLNISALFVGITWFGALIWAFIAPEEEYIEDDIESNEA